MSIFLTVFEGKMLIGERLGPEKKFQGPEKFVKGPGKVAGGPKNL